jgi:hypothetical protein
VADLQKEYQKEYYFLSYRKQRIASVTADPGGSRILHGSGRVWPLQLAVFRTQLLCRPMRSYTVSAAAITSSFCKTAMANHMPLVPALPAQPYEAAADSQVGVSAAN